MNKYRIYDDKYAFDDKSYHFTTKQPIEAMSPREAIRKALQDNNTLTKKVLLECNQIMVGVLSSNDIMTGLAGPYTVNEKEIPVTKKEIVIEKV